MLLHLEEEYIAVKVWQTVRETQITININERISSFANQLQMEKRLILRIHSHNHVNMSQSLNNVIPSAMNNPVVALQLFYSMSFNYKLLNISILLENF